MSRLKANTAAVLMGIALCLMSEKVPAIDVKLDEAAIKQAVEEGKQINDVKKIQVPRFGADLSKDICGGGGEVRTKKSALQRLGALIAADPERAERDKPQVEQAIQKTADAKELKIAFDFCGDTSDFAEDAQATLEQNGRMIKGEMAKPDKAKKNTEGPAYRGKITASFPYSAFDPNAPAKVTLYPKIGDATSWDVDLSQIK
jgi:hypothetical protein